jgi:hypothetical protein
MVMDASAHHLRNTNIHRFLQTMFLHDWLCQSFSPLCAWDVPSCLSSSRRLPRDLQVGMARRLDSDTDGVSHINVWVPTQLRYVCSDCGELKLQFAFPRTASKLGDWDQAAMLGAAILGALYSSSLWRRARRGLEKCYASTLRCSGWSRIQGTGEGHPLAEDTPFQ